LSSCFNSLVLHNTKSVGIGSVTITAVSSHRVCHETWYSE